MLLKIALIALVGFLGMLGTAAGLVWQSGFAYVQVQKPSEDLNLRLPIPMILVDAGLALAPADQLEEARRQLAPWRELLEAACEALEACPEATFVEVQSRNEQVLVAKRGSYLVVDIDNPDEKVYVQVPIHALGNALRQVAGGW
jgi:histidinol-phosphate/aromatic aminotransferase/cobyric acid decarboxylase-like protein